jgi:hypothetical protein
MYVYGNGSLLILTLKIRIKGQNIFGLINEGKQGWVIIIF